MNNENSNHKLHGKVKDMPTLPGVYLYKDKSGRIIYVGKAKQLKNRVASYFRDLAAHSPKTRAMLAQAHDLDILVTETEKEALLLEASLIKKHKPRYNIVLRDDKQYILFKLDKRSAYPRLTLTRRVNRDGALYFGPFTSAHAARQASKAIHRVFPLRICTDRTMGNRVRPCLYHQIGQCLAPCVLEVPQQEYAALVKRVEMLLTGRSSELVSILKEEMLAASEALEFERAAVLRDRIRSVERTVEQQAAVLGVKTDMDVLGLAATEKGLGLGLLFIRQGRLLDKKYFFWPGLGLEDGHEAIEGFLGQYYSTQRYIPGKIMIPWDMEELAGASQDPEYDVRAAQTLADILSDRRGKPTRITHPKSRIEKKLVAMAADNARENAPSAEDKTQNILQNLAAKLRLPALPKRIESVDVSHTRGEETKAGVVVFEDGAPKKEDYRIYAFPEPETPGDDYGILAEWVQRRLDSGPPWPDLLLIDGGRGQLAAVARALEEAGEPDIWPLAAIAKARTRGPRGAKRKTHALDDNIFLPGRSNPASLKPGSPELLFLQNIRDSVHRFSIGKHRRAKRKAALDGELLRLPGVGPKTARLLWEHFESVEHMAQAGQEQLAAIPGVGKKRAQALAEQLRKLRGE